MLSEILVCFILVYLYKVLRSCGAFLASQFCSDNKESNLQVLQHFTEFEIFFRCLAFY